MKRNIKLMICLTFTFVFCMAIAVATSYSGSSNFKNKAYSKDLGDSSAAYMRAYASTTKANTTVRQVSTTRGSVTAKATVSSFKYATNTRIGYATNSSSFSGAGGVKTSDIDRAAGDMNMKYVHTGSIVKNSDDSIYDSFTYTVWQQY